MYNLKKYPLLHKAMNKAGLILPNLVFSLLAVVAVILIDAVVKTIGLNRFTLLNSYPFSYLVLFIVFLLVSFMKSRRVFYYSMVIVSVLILSETLYLQYFGRFIPQQQINDVITESSEIYLVIAEDLHLLLYALVPAILNLVLFISISRLTPSRASMPYAGTSLLVLFLCFSSWVFNYKERFNVAPQTIFLNTHLSVVHTMTMYLAHELPRKFSLTQNPVEAYLADAPGRLERNPEKPVNIIFMMGESLGYDHMSVYGYARQTTPFLEEAAQRKFVFLKKGIAASAKTSITVPHIINMIKKPDGMQQILPDRTNLFRLARQNNMTTHYVTATNIHFLKSFINYMGIKHIDHFIDLNPDREIDNLMDEVVVDYLREVDFSKSNFIMLHMRGSHTPYTRRYTEPFARYPVNKDLTYRERQVNSYDNSVLYTDYVIKKTWNYLKRVTTQPVYFVFTSDHGESLGEDGIYGHLNNRIPKVIRVPIIVMGINGADLSFVSAMENSAINPNVMSQFELCKLVGRMMGYDTPMISEQQDGYYVNGERLDGSAGYIMLKFNERLELVDAGNGTRYVDAPYSIAGSPGSDIFMFPVRSENPEQIEWNP